VKLARQSAGIYSINALSSNAPDASILPSFPAVFNPVNTNLFYSKKGLPDTYVLSGQWDRLYGEHLHEGICIRTANFSIF
jgi:hypothetical protein